MVKFCWFYVKPSMESAETFVNMARIHGMAKQLGFMVLKYPAWTLLDILIYMVWLHGMVICYASWFYEIPSMESAETLVNVVRIHGMFMLLGKAPTWTLLGSC